ncbi:MAG: hypothetical protein AB9834_14400 [Lentimicrobium sp.]
MVQYQSRVSPRDSRSFSENAPFINSFYSPYNLHLQNDTYTLCESGGTAIPSVTTDRDGDFRYPNTGFPVHPVFPATAPDVGADEFAGIPGARTLSLNLFLENLYAGGGTMNPASDGTGPKWGATIADHVTVEMHEATFPYALAGGNLVDLNTDGTASAIVGVNLSESYYIAIRHRNSIETWSAGPVSFAGNSISYDFSNAASRAYGGNQKNMEGVYAIYGGDVNQDGMVDTADITPVDNDSAGYLSGYLVSDVNGDGIVDTGDMTIVDNNAAVYVGAVTP